VRNRKEALLSALKNPDWRVRLQSTNQLADINDEELAATLIEIVKDHHHDLNTLNAALKVLSVPGRSFFPGVAALLNDDEAEIRTYAALTLGLIGDSRAIPLLLDALNDPEKNVQFVAIESLGRLKADAAVDRLLEILQGNDFFLMFPTIQSLTLIGDPKPVPQLIELVNDEGLSEAVITALGALAGEEAVPVTASYLDTAGANAGTAAAALVSIHHRSAEPLQTRDMIIAHLNAHRRGILAAHVLDGSQKIHSQADRHNLGDLAVLLGWLVQAHPMEQLACKALVQLLNHSESRHPALESLKVCTDLITNTLIEALDDPDQDIRHAAMQLFAKNAKKEDVPILEEVLQSEHPELVVLAAEGLARLADQSVYNLLLEKLDSPAAHVRQATLKALEALDHPDHNRHMLILLENSNPVLRETAIVSLARLKQRQYSARILAALADPAENVRRAAVEALPLLQDPQAFYTLEEVLRQEDTGARIAAVKALADCPADFAIPLLHEALKDKDYWVQIHACRSLARHSKLESLPFLVELTRDPMPPLRIAALEALSGLNNQEALQAVLHGLEDDNSDVRMAAERAAERLQSKRLID
jgi:HEAT repeat protein